VVIMEISPYLNFDGQCAAAFKLYEKVLGGKIVGLQTHGESPMAEQVPPEWRSKVLHARLEVGKAVLMGSDVPPPHYVKPQGFGVSLSVDKPEEAERIFNALADGATVQMPIQKTFWSVRFGMLVDRFGIPWMVNCNQAA
jgi:PhnB protein